MSIKQKIMLFVAILCFIGLISSLLSNEYVMAIYYLLVYITGIMSVNFWLHK